LQNKQDQGHNVRGRKKGKLSRFWKGGQVIGSQGYALVHMPDHPRAYSNNYVKKSLLVAEKALGKSIPTDAVVHHADEVRTNDKNNNLVLCEDESFHNLLHVRKRAYDACGHAYWRKCWICKTWDDPENLHIGRNVYHRKCWKKHKIEWIKQKGGKATAQKD